MQQFYAHGKLLISGEYLVLSGALALAVPTKAGQKTEINTLDGEGQIHWKSFDMHGEAYAAVTLAIKDFSVIPGTENKIDETILTRIRQIFTQIRKQDPGFLKDGKSISITHRLEFDRAWGLGSSSSLVVNLARFAHVDPFVLNAAVFTGSGYDIACAGAEHAIFYKIDEEGPVFDTVHFSPPEPQQLFFVYLGNKQDSGAEIKKFMQGTDAKKIAVKYANEIEIVSEISEALLFCDDFKDYMQLLDEHEEVMQYVLQEEKIKTRLFGNFNGTVKSLGAWGGDFILAASPMEPKEIISYFHGKGYTTVIPYSEMVL